jgi:hypothetical protein
MRYLLAILLISTIIATTSTAQAQTSTPTPAPTPVYSATPVHDTWVWDFTPTTNYSTGSQVVYHTFTPRQTISYFYPGIPEVTAQQINSAILWLYFTNTPQPVQVHQTWPVNNTTTWNTRPPSLGIIETVTPTVGWASFDITDTVRQGRGVFLAGNGVAAGRTFIRSKEHTSAPYVTYSYYPTPTPVPTATPSATATPAPGQTIIELPSGNNAVLTYELSAGELFTVGGLLAVLLTVLFILIRSYADKGSVQ